MNKADASIDYPDAYEIELSDSSLGHEDSTTIDASIHEKDIPWFTAAALDRLYGSIYSTLDHFDIGDELHGTSTYVSRKHGEIAAALLFRREGRVATILNQLIAISRDELQRVADTLFAADANLSAIRLSAIRTGALRLHYPHQRFPFTEDIVAALPGSADTFLARLGRNTREIVKRYTNKVKKTFPSFRFDTYIDSNIGEAHARELFRLHHARMRVKKQRTDVDEREFRNILELARRRGMMTVATIDGTVCAGLICWRVERQYYMRVIAHDPRFDDYKLGSVCCYLSMRECIARGGAAFHFLFGRMPYKFRFLGVVRPFDQVVIYRSHLAMARQWRLASRTLLNGMNCKARIWLQDAEHKEDWIAGSVRSCARVWRAVKRIRGKPV